MLARMRRKGNLLTLLVGMQAGAATLENSMEVPQKVENRTTLWPSNCTTGYLPQRYKCSDLKGYVHPNVYSSNVHNSQTMERAKMSTNRWMDKEDVVYIYNGILCSHQKPRNLAICNNVDGTRGYYAKQNKSIRERQVSYDLTDMWDLRNKAEDHRWREVKIKQDETREGDKP